MRRQIKKLWNKFLSLWRAAHARAKIKVQTFLGIFKRENKFSPDLEEQFMKLFSDLEDTITNTLKDINGPEFNTGSA